MKDVSNDILVVVDLSAWLYMMIFNAVSNFEKHYKDEFHSMVKPPEETDQENLPNLLVSDNFKKELKKTVMGKCHALDWILKKNCQDLLDVCDNVWTVLAEDDYTKNSFRKNLYPEYKGTRSLVKQSYDRRKIRSYILGVLFPELELESRYGYLKFGCPGAEADDVIAVMMKNLDGFLAKILISADHDFCQLEGIRQFNLFGDEVIPWVDKAKGIKMNPQEALLVKILTGDGSDNISQVFEKVGIKKAWKLAHDKEKLKKMLKENADAAKQFDLNKKLISFDKIPEDLQKSIMEVVDEKLMSKISNKKEVLDDGLQALMDL